MTERVSRRKFLQSSAVAGTVLLARNSQVVFEAARGLGLEEESFFLTRRTMLLEDAPLTLLARRDGLVAPRDTEARRVFAWLCVGCVVAAYGVFLLTILSLLVADTLGLGNAALGLAFASLSVGGFTSPFLAGMLADRAGPRPVKECGVRGGTGRQSPGNMNSRWPLNCTCSLPCTRKKVSCFVLCECMGQVWPSKTNRYFPQ